MGILNDVAQNNYTTESAEQAQVVSYSIPANSYGRIKFTILGNDVASNNVLGVEKEIIIKRAAGAVSKVGVESVIIEGKDSSLSLAEYNITTSGSSISLTVTGVVNLNISWFVKMEIFLEGNF